MVFRVGDQFINGAKNITKIVGVSKNKGRLSLLTIKGTEYTLSAKNLTEHLENGTYKKYKSILGTEYETF